MTATLTERSEGTAAHKGFNPKRKLENRDRAAVVGVKSNVTIVGARGTVRNNVLALAHLLQEASRVVRHNIIICGASALTSVKIASVVGARPQFIKAAPVSREIRQHHEEILVHTGQHYDENMSDVFFEVLDMPRPDYNLGVGSASHSRQTAEVMHGVALQSAQAARSRDILQRFGVRKGEYILVTLHRPASVDDRSTLGGIVEALVRSGRTVVFPIHPRTRKNLEAFGLWEPLRAKVKAIEPVDYLDFIALLMGASKVVTDSGGVQKEAYFFGVPCITLRDETEWIETVEDGWNALVGTDTADILDAIEKFNPSGTKSKSFGDGHAAEKIALILDKFV